MVKQKLFIALLVPLISGVVGCGGSDGDNVNITNEFGSSSGSGSSSSSSGGGDCNQVVAAKYRPFVMPASHSQYSLARTCVLLIQVLCWSPVVPC